MKKNLCVIFGGESPEHDISQKSVTSVLKHLNKDKYNMDFIIPILRFNFWCEESHQYLDIRFEYGDNCDYYVICLDENETKKMYELLFQQLNI